MKTLRELGIALIHPGPIVTLLLIKLITITASYCCTMWWPPASSIFACLWLFSFFSLSGLTLYNFLAAMSLGPGHVPKGWQPENEEDIDKVQYCSICQGYKAPRAHHCRKCGKCVLKMDHHCPWINECVGHRNHAHFVAFLISAVYGCSQATVIISCSLYHALFRNYYVYHKVKDAPLIYLGNIYGVVWCLFALGCAFGVALGVGLLFVYQLKGILSNRTSIEEWIEEKAHYRRKADPGLPPYDHPYTFGWRNNFGLVLNLKCEAQGDGIIWPVIPTADQYSLTIEQIEQKRDKQKRVQEVIVTEDFSGSWFPVTKGCCVTLHPPCSDESRISLKVGDKLLVSRWKKYWLYGEKTVSGKDSSQEVKGWFPRRCASVKRRHRPTCENYVHEGRSHEIVGDESASCRKLFTSDDSINGVSRDHMKSPEDKKEK